MPYYNPAWNAGKPMITDEEYYSLDVPQQNATPNQGSNTASQGTATSTTKKLPVAISVPGNIITEEAMFSESQIVEELFEDLSLFELMELGRSETVLGMNINYQPIKNISDIYFTYSPKKILALSGTFGVVDEEAQLELGQFSVDGGITIDPLTGDLVIAIDDIEDGFVVQVELLAGGEILDS